MRTLIFMNVITATKARSKLYKLIEETCKFHSPVHITSKRGNAVLVSDDDWSSIMETLHLTSIPGMEESIVRGMKEPIDQCSDKLEW